MRRKLVIGLLVALTGCQAAMYGTASQLNQITTGMPKAEVLAKLGTPNSTAASDGGEFLTYRWMEAVATAWPQDYFVFLVDGRVASFGKKGDFNSTKDPTIGINIKSDTTVREDARRTSVAEPDKIQKLEQLFKLQQQGAITKQEYDEQKVVLLKR
jgi:hypothetical protein